MTDIETRLTNPYTGPRPFRAGETLYGRDREARQLLDLLIAERIVLLHSPSGAGKTSLIRAGLIPRLQAEGFHVLPLARVSLEPPAGVARPNLLNRYLFSFLASCEEALPEDQRLPLSFLATISMEFGSLQRRPRRGFDLLDFDDGSKKEPAPGTVTREVAWQKLRSMDDYLTKRLRQPDATGGEVMIIDQFEEILTCNPHDQQFKTAFFAQLGAALRDRQRWALFAMREDYLAALAPYLRHLPTRLANTFRLDLLETECARQAIQMPARQAQVDFTDAAAQKLVDDLRRVKLQTPEGDTVEALGNYVDPVQLQVVCRRLWEKLPPGTPAIVEANVESMGDVDKALGGYYAVQVELAARVAAVPERAIRDWFDEHLISPHDIRLQVLMGPEASDGLDNRVIQLLQNAYLVRTEKRGGATWFELSHDRLIKPVKADNAAWREAHLTPLQRQAALWEKEGRPDGLLLRGEALTAAERWVHDQTPALIPAERDYLDACLKARTAAEREQRRNRLVRRLAIYSTVGMVTALVMAVLAGYFWLQAAHQTRQALSRQLAAAAVLNLNVDQERSLLLSLQAAAVTLHPGLFEPAVVLPEAQSALHRALAGLRIERTLPLTGAGKAVAYRPDGRRLAGAAGDGTVKVWDLATGQVVLTLAADAESADGVAFSPDGTRLATAGQDGTAKVWDAATGQLRLTLAGHSGAVLGVAFNPPGTRLATASEDGTARVWDAATGQSLQVFSGHAGAVHSAVFSPDGQRLLTAGADNTARLWDAATGAALRTLEGHTDAVLKAAFSPDGRRVATASADRTASVWEADSGRKLFTLTGHVDYVSDVAFSPDGQALVTASMDRVVQLWHAADQGELFALLGHADYVVAAAFSPDGAHVATASVDGTVKVWNVSPDGSRELFTVHHNQDVTAVAFSPDGQTVVTGSADQTARLWDARTGQKLQQLTGHLGEVTGVAYSPDGARVATVGHDGTARLWDVATGRPVLTLTGPPETLNAVTFSPDGHTVATAGSDGTVRLWDAASGTETLTLKGHTETVYGVAYSDDGRRLVSAGYDRRAVVWDAASGEKLLTLDTPQELYDALFSPDGKLIVTAGEGPAILWDAATGRPVRTLPGHTAGINTIAFSPDGRHLATASADRTVKLWNVATGKEELTLYGFSDSLYGVAFSPDGRHLFAGSGDGTARMYVLPADELVRLAQARVTRSLTAGECETYLPDSACPQGR